MNTKCKSFVLSAFIASTMISGCATVDMTGIAPQNTAAISSDDSVNVVKRAATKLYTVFTNRGFVEKTSRNKMRSAAIMLLKGLQAKPLDDHSNYIKNVGSIDGLKADIALALSHVEQTRSAAAIYLAMAPSETVLREELSSLEKALLAATQAKQSFMEAAEYYGAEADSDFLMSYRDSLVGLRNVTNAFGERVRASVTTKEPAIIG